MSSTPTKITEAQVVAFLLSKINEIKAKLGADKYAVAGITVTEYTHGTPTIRCRVDSGAFSDVLPEADSFARAFASIEERTPENIAREKREAAARLLAEAEALPPAAK